jgi:hypothetical protein
MFQQHREWKLQIKHKNQATAFHLFACRLQLTCKNELIQNKIDLQKRSQLLLDLEIGPCITGKKKKLEISN